MNKNTAISLCQSNTSLNVTTGLIDRILLVSANLEAGDTSKVDQFWTGFCRLYRINNM